MLSYTDSKYEHYPLRACREVTSHYIRAQTLYLLVSSHCELMHGLEHMRIRILRGSLNVIYSIFSDITLYVIDKWLNK